MRYPIIPNTKPRMTRADKWKQRPAVMQYRRFKDEVRSHGVILPENYHVIFVLPMPQSWSKKRKEAMLGKPHRQTPDKDNLEKALLDSLYEQDCGMWDGRVTKIWGTHGEIIIQEISPPDLCLLK
ncbi:MAG: RusA family crossover junction endodeoxyribonuclease [Plesiomonas shigelloides]